ncbi:MAG: hypothetical protein ACFFAE_21735 [Candidatus Hodarchaeota archaeon]
MSNEKYTIRDYEEGDEKVQVSIFNYVMSRIDPNMPLTTPEEIRIRNPIYGSLRMGYEYESENIKFLIHSEDGIVGYAECYSRLGSYNLHYPLILKKHCREGTLNLLFKTNYDLAKSKNAKRIHSTYNNEYKEIHSYIKNQQIVPIKSISENKRLVILTDELNYNVTDFNFIPFNQDKIDDLLDFRYSKEEIVGRDLSREELISGFESGKYSPENSTLIFKNDRLVAWWSVRINSPPYDYDKTLTHPIGVLNELVIDFGYENLPELRKAMFKAGYKFLKSKEIPEFRLWASCSGQFFKEYANYGFRLTGEGEYEYTYE